MLLLYAARLMTSKQSNLRFERGLKCGKRLWILLCPEMKIIIKPNLVSFKKPDAAATTHPALLEALVGMLLARGADVTIGDSPGGPHSLPLLNRVYAATGMDRLEKLGAKLNRNMNEKNC